MFVLLASGDAVIGSQLVSEVTEFSLPIASDWTITENSWFSTGQLQLQLQVFFSVTTNGLATKSGTERYLNPTQSQLGYYTLLSENFVVHDERIKYEQQAFQAVYPLVQIANTSQDARITLATTTACGISHGQNIAPITICGDTQQLTVPPPGLSQGAISASIGDGGICTRILPGAIEMTELQPYVPGEKIISLSGRDFLIPDEIRGLVYSGYILEVGYLLGYHATVSTAVQVTPDPFLPKNAPFVPVVYTCPQFGGEPQPVTPLECGIATSDVIYAQAPDGSGLIAQITCGFTLN